MSNSEYPVEGIREACHDQVMHDRYEPESTFLKAIIAEEVLLSGSEWADDNLQRLIDLTRDEVVSNRDWATFLLAQEDADTPAVTDALLHAASDREAIVRAEAVLGLAKRDALLALPFVQRALKGNRVTVPILEAAEICADRSLVADLRVWAEPSDAPLIDKAAADALAACGGNQF